MDISNPDYRRYRRATSASGWPVAGVGLSSEQVGAAGPGWSRGTGFPSPVPAGHQYPAARPRAAGCCVLGVGRPDPSSLTTRWPRPWSGTRTASPGWPQSTSPRRWRPSASCGAACEILASRPCGYFLGCVASRPMTGATIRCTPNAWNWGSLTGAPQAGCRSCCIDPVVAVRCPHWSMGFAAGRAGGRRSAGEAARKFCVASDHVQP